MSYDNSIFNNRTSIFLILCFDIGFRSHFGGVHHIKLSKGSQLSNIASNIVSTIWKMIIYYKVDYIENEPALGLLPIAMHVINLLS